MDRSSPGDLRPLVRMSGTVGSPHRHRSRTERRNVISRTEYGDSSDWVSALTGSGPAREQAVASLHELLLRVARREVSRRRAAIGVDGPELDDLAHQAAADAVIAIIAKIGRFRGESRFTTWAYKFVVLEVSNKIGRHFWQRRTWPMEQEEWDRLPDRFGIPPADQAAGPLTKS
jgi:hypothetical protein